MRLVLFDRGDPPNRFERGEEASRRVDRSCPGPRLPRARPTGTNSKTF